MDNLDRLVALALGRGRERMTDRDHTDILWFNRRRGLQLSVRDRERFNELVSNHLRKAAK